jgi:hypothetical protein
MPSFVPCPACSRHVRLEESSCPFCSAALPLSIARARPVVDPSKRMGRAAMFAVGAAVASTIACSDPGVPLYGAPAPDSGPRRDSGSAMRDSGAEPSDSGTSMDSGADRDSATSMDSGTDSGSISVQDSGVDAGEGVIMALYGAPPRPE